MSETDILLCRPGFESALCAELRESGAVPGTPGLGYVPVEHPAGRDGVFESGRLAKAKGIAPDELKPMTPETARQVFDGITATSKPWTIRAWTPEVVKHEEHARRLKGITANLLRLLAKADPLRAALYREPESGKAEVVLQLALTGQGLWYAVCQAGQVPPAFRMKMDSQAPSRSYLKIEEAFVRMGDYPKAGDRVLDLGAAPGGWTYAFLKRGCRVTAVDHGQLKLPPQAAWKQGHVTHLRENGLTYAPEGGRLDWMVSDMLVAPGEALGLLRRWLEGGRAHRVVCNMKIPQREPYAAIRPLLQYLKKHTHRRLLVKQLYHDRREITVMVWGKD